MATLIREHGQRHFLVEGLDAVENQGEMSFLFSALTQLSSRSCDSRRENALHHGLR